MFKALLLKYALPYWPLFLGLLFLNLILVVLGMASTALIAAITHTLDYRNHPLIETSHDSASLWSYNLKNIGDAIFRLIDYKESSLFHIVLHLAALGFCFAVTKAFVQMGADFLSSYTTALTCRRMRIDLFGHLMSFPMSFYHHNKTGNLVSRVDSDVQESTNGLQQVINGFIVNPLMLCFYARLIMNTSWVLLLAIFVAGGAHHLLTYVLSRPANSNIREGLDQMADLRGMLYEVFSNIRVVKSLSSEVWERNRLLKVLHNYMKTSMIGQLLGSLQNQGRIFINTCVQLIILVFSAHELASGRLDFQSCSFFLYICIMVVNPISDMSAAFMVLQRMLTASERVIGFMRVAPSLKDGTALPTSMRTQMCLKGVSFAYDKREVLRSVSLEIKKGEMIALVGPSGAGKSTMVDLILRFYDPTHGKIELDGVDIRNFQQRHYRQMFGIVSQESLLFNSSVRENIAYGRHGLTEAQIKRACDMAHVSEFIPTLPNGLDSLLGDRGVRLSGGQRQRLSIARALVAEPTILILDEATSSLDSESEKLVKDAIDQVTKTTTSIVVAHRLSTILHANRIVVLENGQIDAVGPHDELLESCALYRKLYSLQFNSSPAGNGHL